MDDGVVEQIVVCVDGVTEDEAVSLLVAFNFNLEDALAFTQPTEVKPNAPLTHVDDWQLFEAECTGKVYRFGVLNRLTAGQLKQRMLMWFGHDLGLTVDQGRLLEVAGIPMGDDMASNPLCHLQLDVPQRLKVSKQSLPSAYAALRNGLGARHPQPAVATSGVPTATRSTRNARGGGQESGALEVDGAAVARSMAVQHAAATSACRKMPIAVPSDDDDDDDEYVDAAMDLSDEDPGCLVDMPADVQRGSLIPEHCVDEEQGLTRFAANFSARFGYVQPIFFIGSLTQAIRTAFAAPVPERRLLAVYVHHDHSVAANVFCSQVLTSEPFTETLSQNCIFWAWDVTHDKQQANLMTIVGRSLNDDAASAMRLFNKQEYPVLVLLTQTSFSIGSLEVASIISGTSPVSEALGLLTTAIEAYSVVKDGLQGEQIELEQRRRLLSQQNREFEEAAQQDRQRLDAAHQEQDKQIQHQREKAEQEQREQIEEEEQKREARALRDTLPEEPGAGPGVYSFCFRLPSGDRVTRNFLPTHTLEIVLRYVASLGFGDSSVYTSFPRKDLTELPDDSTAISELGLQLREVLTVD